ncbi:RING1 and YY1-binding protein isoform X4 [Heteronotia binoei]|uniref:RING1 and YY1-binding protein isoform X4 n=1 Tax=Heteronotia binoei TaxID=13085 RepID=UPI00292E5031|nr:RING1 and YY1-binding protein isoform X4 [Heteronotia binoei]
MAAPHSLALFPLTRTHTYSSSPHSDFFQTKGDLTRPKRQAKPAADEGFWDCSVCTFRNSAEAFKCSICDVRKGTSTRPKSDIVKDPPSEANSIQSGNTTTKTSDSNHTSRPRLKNVDRSTAQQLAVTVGNVTVIITDFKEKTRSSSTSSSTVTSSAGSEQQNQSSSGSESTDKGSSRSSTPKGDMSAVNDESF